MYHIAEDKRVQRSAALICEGMLLCLEEKELSQITVTDLWKTSGVSRATFYRLFDNVLDVITFQCEQVISSIVETLLQSPPCVRSYQKMTVAILEAAMRQHRLLYAVSQNNRLDIIYGALRKQIPVLHQIYQVDTENKNGLEEYFLNCVCSLISTMIDLWVRHGQELDAEALYLKFAQVIRMLDESFGGASST